MKQGILLYALNNEQIDYVEIAYNAALRAKKHLKLPVAIVTDSADWLYNKFPNYREVFDMVIRIVHENIVEDWKSNKYYGVGSLAFHNGTIWRKVRDGNEVVNVINKEVYYTFNLKHFTSVYEGIDIDKWYPDLPYLAGQHVWYNDVLYRCHTDYGENNEFSIDKYDVLIEKVLDRENDPNYVKGDIVLYKRTLWQAIEDKIKKIELSFDNENFEQVYIGIDIDKWYPNLPYLAGQHVWYNDVLYRCHTRYVEQDTFSVDNYDVLIPNVLDFDNLYSLSAGQTVLYDRNLWLSKISVDNTEPYTTDLTDFDRVYEGIDIDIWYPNLPYLKGQHVWHENTLYRCEVGYTEENEFSKDKYILFLENVQLLSKVIDYRKGELFLDNRVLWLSNKDSPLDDSISVWYNIDNFERIYEGITIDKWYPNLPYLAGQHVWQNNILYKCHTDYEEGDVFSINQYDIVLENVKDLSAIEIFKKGDILLHERVLWLSQVNYEYTLNKEKIRDDIWEDTKERHVVHAASNQYRNYFDGALSNKRLKFKNDIRIRSFELSPFDETLVIDCDYFINNDTLRHCWKQPHDFLIFKDSVDLSGYRFDPRLKTLSDKSINFYWATVFFFRKNKNTETFFRYLGHIQENWNYYRYVYQIDNSMYRNDFSFSIAIHVMNGYQEGSWAQPLPGKLYYTIDKDLLIEYENNNMKFLIEKEKYKGEYTILKTKDINVHVMNKFSLSRIFSEVSYV